MKKLFTFAFAALLSAGVWAETAILSWQMGENGAYAEAANVITGATGCAAEGWTIAITGNTSKNWTAGNGKIFLNGDSIMTLKNSNGAQNTVTLPEGLYASRVEFYVVTNDTAAKGVLAELDGEVYKDSVESLKDYDHPTVIVKALETPKNAFTFTFKAKQVCFIAVVTYSDQAPEAPKPYGLLSWQLGENGAEAVAANSITGATGSAAEGWTIAMANPEKNWGAGGKMNYKGVEYKTLKNSNGVENTITLPEGLYATDVEFRAVTNDAAEVGSLKEFDGESCKDTVFALKTDYANPTIITKELATPKNQFTFLFGGKQVCFLAIVHYTDEEPAGPGEGVENVQSGKEPCTKVIENGQIVILKNGVRYNILGSQL
ncbi:MAG: hypothetical protein IKQ48_00640 [Paludibacteraceae bacterium]|nr:hypothetical protein [Paludibacteraceae bacterium]